MPPQFHETGYGSRFFNAQLPALIKAISRVADGIEIVIERLDEQDEKTKEIIEKINLSEDP